MNLAWQAALSEATPRRSTAGMMTEGQQQERQHHQQQQQRDAPSRSGGMLALLLGRAGGEATAAAAVDDRSDNTYDGDGDGEREQEVQTVTNANNNANNDWVYPGYDVDFGWRPMPPAPARTSSPPASPRFSSHETSSAVSSFNAYPGGGGVRSAGSTPRHQLRPSPSSPSSSTSTSSQLAPPPSARDEQLLYDGSSSSNGGSGLRSGRTSIGDEYMQPYGYYLHLPRPSLPSFELLPTPMPIPTISGFMPSSSSSSSSFPFCPSTTATTATSAAAAAATTGPPSPFEADLYGRMSWPSTPSAMSASSSSLPDIFRPSILFGPSSSSSTQTYASSWPPPTYGAATGSGLGLTPGSDSASSSSASSSFSCSPPTMQMLAWQPWQASASPATSPMSSSSSSCSFSSPELSMASTSATAAEPTPTSPTSRSRRKRTRSAGSSESTSSSSKGKKKAGTPSTQSSAASAAPRKPILRRKMEEEYYHYLKEKLSRMESTRKKRAAALAAGNHESLSSSPESSDLACILSPELGAVSVDDLRREEEQLYMSGTAMECFRYFHEKISSFLVVENVELTNEVWVKSALRSIVCQVTPFALKINAILAFGALIGGQRQWADIFFDKWRRLLTEFFDSSDYEVAEGLTVMSYYLFYLGDIARSRCFGESAAQISVRARPGGGLIFIRAQTITEIISSGASAALCENIVGAGCTSLYLKKPLLTFPATIDEGTRLALSGLLEQLILVSSRIHMWRTCQQIAECRDRGRRARRRRKSSSDTCGGVKKRSQCPNAALSSPLHQLSVLQAVEEKLESLEQRQREALGHASKKSAAGGRKGSAQLSDIQSLATAEASEHASFLDDLLAFSRFVLFSVRVDCHREAGMTKNAYTSAEKLLIQLEREADRFMKYVAVLSPLVLSFISPVIELLCGPLQEQFLSAAESVRATTLLLPLGEIFPTLLPVNLTAVAALHAPVSLPVSTSTSSSAS